MTSSAALFIKQSATIKEQNGGQGFIHEDFVVDPFHPDEFIIRLTSIWKRAIAQRKQGIQWNGIFVDLEKGSARFKARDLVLTRKEFVILKVLVESRGGTVCRERIAQQVWPSEIENLRMVDRHVSTLRRKLVAANGPKIHGMYGLGYRLVP